MRKRFEIQYDLSSVPIEDIVIPKKSRDQLPPILAGLKYIFITPELHEQVFAILEKRIPLKRLGRKGLNLWEIFVFSVVRLALNIDYDRLEHTVNYDSLVRLFVGADSFGKTPRRYVAQTLIDNISLLDEETLQEINLLIVKSHHVIVKKKGPKKKVLPFV